MRVTAVSRPACICFCISATVVSVKSAGAFPRTRAALLWLNVSVRADRPASSTKSLRFIGVFRQVRFSCNIGTLRLFHGLGGSPFNFFQIHITNRKGDMMIVVKTVAMPRIPAKIILRKAAKKLFMNRRRGEFVQQFLVLIPNSGKRF